MKLELEKKLLNVANLARRVNDPMEEVNDTIHHVNLCLEEVKVGERVVLTIPGKTVRGLAYDQFEGKWQVGVKVAGVGAWHPLHKAKRIVRLEAHSYLPSLLDLLGKALTLTITKVEEMQDGAE